MLPASGGVGMSKSPRGVSGISGSGISSARALINRADSSQPPWSSAEIPTRFRKWFSS